MFFFPFVCVCIGMCACAHACTHVEARVCHSPPIVQGRLLYWNPELISSAGILSIFSGCFPSAGIKGGSYALLVFMWVLEIQTLVLTLAQEALYSLGLLSGPSTSCFDSDSYYCKSSRFFSCWVVSHFAYQFAYLFFFHDSYLYCFQFGAMIWTKLLQTFLRNLCYKLMLYSPEETHRGEIIH